MIIAVKCLMKIIKYDCASDNIFDKQTLWLAGKAAALKTLLSRFMENTLVSRLCTYHLSIYEHIQGCVNNALGINTMGQHTTLRKVSKAS